MIRKLINDKVKFLLALLGFVGILCYILGCSFVYYYPTDLEKVYITIFWLFFFLWSRIEYINLYKKGEIVEGEQDGNEYGTKYGNK